MSESFVAFDAVAEIFWNFQIYFCVNLLPSPRRLTRSNIHQHAYVCTLRNHGKALCDAHLIHSKSFSTFYPDTWTETNSNIAKGFWFILGLFHQSVHCWLQAKCYLFLSVFQQNYYQDSIFFNGLYLEFLPNKQ